MVEIARGLWWDYSRSPIQGATITLSLGSSNILVSGLTLLVTLATASVWNIATFILHSCKVRPGPVAVVDLQQQVSLQNSRGPLGTLVELVKIYLAWSERSQPGMLSRTCLLAVPALVVWAGGVVAAIFVSRVAHGANGSIVALAEPFNCGLWVYNRSDSRYGNQWTQPLVETQRARTYVGTFYKNTSSSMLSRSLFTKAILPYNTTTSAPCPIAASERCLPATGTSFGMSTSLDSHGMLGINARAENRVILQWDATCSPVHAADLVELYTDGNNTYEAFMLGPTAGSANNITWLYNIHTSATGVDYLLWPLFSIATSADTVWEPIPDFNRTDADVSIFLLSQNLVTYSEPVNDIWFSARGGVNLTDQATNQTYFQSDYSATVMACAEQYALCNPSTSVCSPAGGVIQLIEAVLSDNIPDFNLAQMVTAGRLTHALVNLNLLKSMTGLGSGALAANDLVNMHISPGLPDNQWQLEVLGWFQTGLVKLQTYMIEFVSKPEGSSSYLIVDSPSGPNKSAAIVSALQDQCAGQLVQTSGEVQNFSFVGVLVIVCVSAVLVCTDLLLETIVDAVGRRLRRGVLVGRAARQADDKHHLLRMALGEPTVAGNSWELGRGGVPVLSGAVVAQRPGFTDTLANYGTNSDHDNGKDGD